MIEAGITKIIEGIAAKQLNSTFGKGIEAGHKEDPTPLQQPFC